MKNPRFAFALAASLLSTACAVDRQIGGSGGGGGAGGETTTCSTTTSPPPDLGCEVGGASDLPGVRVEITSTACVLSLSDPSPELVFNYNIVIDADLAGVTPAHMDAGWCDEGGPSGLATLGVIEGGDQKYCECDVGYCMGEMLPTVTLKQGVYPGSFTWGGHNWTGTSDTNNPIGPPFEVGDYTFTLKAKGTIAVGGGDLPFEVRGTTSVHVVP